MKHVLSLSLSLSLSPETNRFSSRGSVICRKQGNGGNRPSAERCLGWSGALCGREIGSLYLSASPFKIPFVGRNEKEGEKCENSVRPAPASGSLSCPSGGRCLQKTAVDKTSVYLLPRLTGCVRCRGNGGETHCHERASGHPASAAKGNSSKRQIAIYSKVTLLSAPCDSRLSVSLVCL